MSGYVAKTLATDEEIVHRANFNWTYSFFPVMWFMFGALTLAFIAFVHFTTGLDYSELQFGWWSAGVAALSGSVILINHMIILTTTEIVVTSYRFVYKTGLVSRNTQEVSLNKIEEITLHQTVFGRLLGFGKLVLRGTGVGVITLPDLDNPVNLRRIIENAKSTIRSSRNNDGE